MTTMKIIVTRWIPAPYHAFQIGRFTFIRPEHRNDKDTLAHEAFHGEEQLRMGVPTWYWRYNTDMDFKLRAEARAYNESMRNGMTRENAVKWLMTYGDISTAYALALLEQENRVLPDEAL